MKSSSQFNLVFVLILGLCIATVFGLGFDPYYFGKTVKELIYGVSADTYSNNMPVDNPEYQSGYSSNIGSGFRIRIREDQHDHHDVDNDMPTYSHTNRNVNVDQNYISFYDEHTQNGYYSGGTESDLQYQNNSSDGGVSMGVGTMGFDNSVDRLTQELTGTSLSSYHQAERATWARKFDQTTESTPQGGPPPPPPVDIPLDGGAISVLFGTALLGLKKFIKNKKSDA